MADRQTYTREGQKSIADSDLLNEWDKEKNERDPSTVPLNSAIKYFWICPSCDRSYVAAPSNRNNGRACPHCNISHGEREIRKVLDKLGIIYEAQKHIGNRLRLDFFIPSISLGIEFNGRQHYEPVDFSNKHSESRAKLEFEKVQKRDLLKEQLCRDLNFRLLIIPHWELHNIPSILERELSNGKKETE